MSHLWSVEVLNGGISSGQYQFQVQAPVVTPWISYVNPATPTANGNSQSFTVYGGNFQTGATVTLRDLTTGAVYTNRPISSQGSTWITINPSFGTVSHLWSVEVLNGGISSGQYVFRVNRA